MKHVKPSICRQVILVLQLFSLKEKTTSNFFLCVQDIPVMVIRNEKQKNDENKKFRHSSLSVSVTNSDIF